jgi:hypothetical protein
VSRRHGQKLPPFTSLFRHTTKSAAWAALSVGARATFFELQENYNTNRQNTVFLSARTGSKKLNAGAKAVLRWMHELEHYGFIVMVQDAHLGVHGSGKAAHYRLTDRPYGGKPPTYDFQNWDGTVFEPTKHSMTGSDIRRLRKQNPVSRKDTPRVPQGHIRTETEMAENAEKRVPQGHIRTEPGCGHAGHIDSLTSSSESQGARRAVVVPLRRPPRPKSQPIERSESEQAELMKILAQIPIPMPRRLSQ